VPCQRCSPCVLHRCLSDRVNGNRHLAAAEPVHFLSRRLPPPGTPQAAQRLGRTTHTPSKAPLVLGWQTDPPQEQLGDPGAAHSRTRQNWHRSAQKRPVWLIEPRCNASVRLHRLQRFGWPLIRAATATLRPSPATKFARASSAPSASSNRPLAGGRARRSAGNSPRTDRCSSLQPRLAFAWIPFPSSSRRRSV